MIKYMWCMMSFSFSVECFTLYRASTEMHKGQAWIRIYGWETQLISHWLPRPRLGDSCLMHFFYLQIERCTNPYYKKDSKYNF